jgi:pimeloyl-ACP methyl ester carboxylesterase
MNNQNIKKIWIEPYEKSEFEFEGKLVTIVHPIEPLSDMPWAWKGEFLNAFPDTELALLEKGFHVVSIEYPDMFGSPQVVETWNNLYHILVNEYKFANKPALIGLSRGGLYCYNWAIANPEKVACIYGDAPVCDMRSWPGGKGKGVGSPDNWKQAIKVYGFLSEDEFVAYDGNPIDNLLPLKEHNIPILHVYGDSDDVVPWEENTGVVAERYQAMGGNIKLISKPGCGHHPHGLSDPKPIVNFILKHTETQEN